MLIMPPLSLAELVMRQLTPEQRSDLRLRDVLITFSPKLQKAYLANSSQRLTAFIRRAFWALKFVPELAAVRMRCVISRYNNMLRWEREDNREQPRYGPGFGDFDLREVNRNRRPGF